MTKKQAILELLDAYAREGESVKKRYNRSTSRCFDYSDINNRNYKERVFDYYEEWKSGRKTATECVCALKW